MIDNNNNGKIYTIDYDGDPTSHNINKSEWEKLRNIRNKNLLDIKLNFPNCEVNFIEGDSRKVLPSIFNKYNINSWDFFYQDSMHFFDDIMNEWSIMKPYANDKAFVIFDDLNLKDVKKFKNWFIKNEKMWDYKIINTGHKQLLTWKL